MSCNAALSYCYEILFLFLAYSLMLIQSAMPLLASMQILKSTPANHKAFPIEARDVYSLRLLKEEEKPIPCLFDYVNDVRLDL